MRSHFLYPFLFALFFISLIALEGILCRPLLPVDETRYVTVAWEMFSSKNWILPTLNFEAYHHKPPLLFWMIVSLWSIFGPLQSVAQAVPYIIFAGLISANMYLVKSLFPRDGHAPTWMMILTLGSLPLLIYSNLIMFDLLLTVFAILSLASLWNFARTGHFRHILFLSICIGLGGLAKGPVILLNIIFVILLYPLWVQAKDKIISNRKWYILSTLAILGGVGITLLWAIPASLQGGAEYANKIFWGQTAGRVENSFDHGRPIWWYLPLLPLLLCPWIFMPKLWRNILKWPETSIYLDGQVLRFLMAWIIPVFICFSLISGKQIHYLFPCLIGALVFTGMVISNDKSREVKYDVILPAIVIIFLVSLPALLKLYAVEMSNLFDRHLMDDVFLRITALYSIGGAVITLCLFCFVRNQSWLRQLMVIALSMVIFMGVLHLEGEKSFYKNYDLSPMAKIISQNKERPMAFLRNYHGEWGFMARLDKPVQQIIPEELPAWFDKNPTGIAFLRTSKEEEFRDKYDIIFEMPYKMNNTFTILVPKGMGQKFVHSQQ